MLIPVHWDGGNYDIVLENGGLKEAGKHLDLNRKVLVVTDSGVPAQYADTVASQCREAVRVCLPQGEASKNLDNFRRLLAEMVAAGFTRKDCVVAVGGGVVGDLSGFAASCYMRGIDFYNIPTTLLSQVDSSIGGKTAIDFEGVKNIVGAFYNPKKVIVDPSTLDTLDQRLLHAGLAEAIKMAATSDGELFEIIEKSEDLRADLPDIIRRSLLIKKDVVEKDPKEKGLRRVLNFGHTVGHAVESLREGVLYHGECVAIGMIPMCGDTAKERITRVLVKYNLPVSSDISPERLLPGILHDKKKENHVIRAVVVEEIGSFRFLDLSPEEIRQRVEEIV